MSKGQGAKDAKRIRRGRELSRKSHFRRKMKKDSWERKDREREKAS